MDFLIRYNLAEDTGLQAQERMGGIPDGKTKPFPNCTGYHLAYFEESGQQSIM